MAPNTRGVRLLTRPPRISGAPDQSAIGVTSTPASARCFAVPPVERISTPFARSALASSTIPRLSETERRARSIRIHHDRLRHPADIAAGLFPDEVVEVHDIGHRVRVTERCHAERGGAVVEIVRRSSFSVAGVLL